MREKHDTEIKFMTEKHHMEMENLQLQKEILDQAFLVNANLEFLDLVVRWPGSSHNSNIFSNSRLRSRMELPEFPDSIILGDVGYALSHYLLTPLANPITKAEKFYNEPQIRTQNVVKWTFGVWKKRFLFCFLVFA